MNIPRRNHINPNLKNCCKALENRRHKWEWRIPNDSVFSFRSYCHNTNDVHHVLILSNRYGKGYFCFGHALRRSIFLLHTHLVIVKCVNISCISHIHQCHFPFSFECICSIKRSGKRRSMIAKESKCWAWVTRKDVIEAQFGVIIFKCCFFA